jgi:hypothetical protein
MQDKPITELEGWEEIPASEMFTRVITAVDAARGDAEAHGDEEYVRYCNAVLFPFLEREREKAQIREVARKELQLREPRPDATAFGRVVISLMEARGMPTTPKDLSALGDRAGLDGFSFLDRMCDADVGDIGYLDGLRDVLSLTEHEITRLSRAYALEEKEIE